MTPRIVVDSTCDLPPEVVERYGIEVIPVYVNIGGKSYLDGVDLTRRQFYRDLPNYKVFPQTAAPSPSHFVALYERLFAEGASSILSIHLSGTLSSTVEMAAKAAADLSGRQIEVFDSGQLSLGAGFLAQMAAEGYRGGWSTEQVLGELRDQASRTFVLAALDTLEYLRRSGRVSSLMAGLGGLLQLKPILKMHDGVAKSERVRTRKRAYSRLEGIIELLAPLEMVAFVHSHSPERAGQLRARLGRLLPEDGTIPSMDITPVIGAHIGPGAAGVACVACQRPSGDGLAAIMG